MRKKARMRAGRRTTNAKKVRPPKVIRGTRHSPPAGATPKRKPPEAEPRMNRTVGLFDTEETELEAELLPPAIGDAESGIDAAATAQRIIG